MRRWALVAVLLVAGCGGSTSLDADASCGDWLDNENGAARRQLTEATLEALGSADPDGLSSEFADEVAGYCEAFPSDDAVDVIETIWLGRGSP